MQLRSLIIIALRVYSLYWLVVSITDFIMYAPSLLSASFSVPLRNVASWVMFVPLGMFVIALLMWALAARLAGLIVKGEDTQLVFTTLTRCDFYLFAFVFLGLYFILSSIAAALQALYGFFAFDLFLPDSERKGRYLVPLLGHGFTIAAGFACLFRSRKWTNKLVVLDTCSLDSLQKPQSHETS